MEAMNKEMYEKMERLVNNKLDRLSKFGGDMGEVEKNNLMNDVYSLTGMISEYRKDEYERLDKEERRRIDEENKKMTSDIEIMKQELTWKKVGMEALKTFGPLLVSLTGYNMFQKRILKFEETGRLTSTASRELHLPSFLKK